MMARARLAFAVAGLVALTGCAGEAVWDSDEFVSRSTYVPSGPPTVTLITSINTRDNSGAHSSLLIDGAQRLLFDPAGSWHNPGVPERNDVLFGMSDPYMQYYLDFQANGDFEVQMQTIQVTPQIAQQLAQAVQTYGPVSPAFCSRAISTILSQTPGFESISVSFFPLNNMEEFGRLPGVTETYYVGSTSGGENNSDTVLEGQLAGQI